MACDAFLGIEPIRVLRKGENAAPEQQHADRPHQQHRIVRTCQNA